LGMSKFWELSCARGKLESGANERPPNIESRGI
jgi:hypothetical protein